MGPSPEQERIRVSSEDDRFRLILGFVRRGPSSREDLERGRITQASLGANAWWGSGWGSLRSS
ncbi:MAG: hypothetical protein DIJKHBIC_04368 [Thermoanaerobaculia bacterium]|nr:hypothetical protein [Thermoanaerobaculia bacterium]